MALTKSEQQLVEYKKEKRELKAAIREAGSPERLFLGAAGGGLAGYGFTRLLDVGVGKLLEVKAGEKPGFFKSNPALSKGLAIGGAGLAIHVANLAFPYKYPFDLVREMVHQGSAGMVVVGLDRTINNWPKSQPQPQLPQTPQAPAK